MVKINSTTNDQTNNQTNDDFRTDIINEDLREIYDTKYIIDPESNNIQHNIYIMLTLYKLCQDIYSINNIKSIISNNDINIKSIISNNDININKINKELGITNHIKNNYYDIINLFHIKKENKEANDYVKQGLYDNAVISIPTLSKLTDTINCIISKSIIC